MAKTKDGSRLLVGILMIAAGVFIVLYYGVFSGGGGYSDLPEEVTVPDSSKAAATEDEARLPVTAPVDTGSDPVGVAGECIQCGVGQLGGGCSYVNEGTGEVVMPGGCIPALFSEMVDCSAGCSSDGGPVCGIDGRDYTDSCAACLGKSAFTYFEGTCDEFRALGS